VFVASGISFRKKLKSEQIGLDARRAGPILHLSDASLNAGVQTTWLTGKTVRPLDARGYRGRHGENGVRRIRNSEPNSNPGEAGDFKPDPPGSGLRH
jgi:hypothetical protein